MARLPRFNVVGQAQHVIVRGNNREPIFYADEDYLFYLEKLWIKGVRVKINNSDQAWYVLRLYKIM